MPAAASLGRSQSDCGPAGRGGAASPDRCIAAGGCSIADIWVVTRSHRLICLKTVNAGLAYIRKAAIRPDNREVKDVPAYSHSDRWVGASGAWGDAWVGAGEIPWSQGIRNLRCGTVFRIERAVP